MIATKQVTVPTAVEAAGDKSLQTIHNNTHSLTHLCRDTTNIQAAT